MHHLNPDRSKWALEDQPTGAFRRAEAVLSRIDAADEELSLEFVREAARCVAATVPMPAESPWAPGRTLWHALYFPEERRLEVDFYLGEGTDRPRRSPNLTFELAGSDGRDR